MKEHSLVLTLAGRNNPPMNNRKILILVCLFCAKALAFSQTEVVLQLNHNVDGQPFLLGQTYEVDSTQVSFDRMQCIAMSVRAKMRKKSKNVKLGHNTSLSTFHHIDKRDSPLSLRERIPRKGSTTSYQVYIGRGTLQNVRRRSAHRSWFCSWFTSLASHLGTIRWQKS